MKFDVLFANFELTSIVSSCGVSYFDIFKKIWDITGKVTIMVISMTGFIEEETQ